MKATEMQAGRALDAMVAQRVMGWHRLPGYNYWMTFSRGGAFHLHGLIATWSPSTNPSHAKEVIAVMLERGIPVIDAAPLAVCRAALDALEVAP